MLKQIIIGTILLTSCNESQREESRMAKDTLLTKVDTAEKLTKSEITTDTFNIESLIPEYRNDTNFHKISGLQVRTGVQEFYYYSIYKMPKKKVISAFNRLPKTALSIKANGQIEYAKCNRIENKYFFDKLYEEGEDNPVSQNFFYRFKTLKEYEIYAYFSTTYMHQIIFDKNSDTVYHRVRLVIY